MSALKLHFESHPKLIRWGYILSIIGIIALVAGFSTEAFSADPEISSHFWGTLMYNSIFWTLVCNAVMFFICITTLAMAGFTQSFRRVAEAISTLVPIFGTIAFLVLIYQIISHNHHIYHWLDKDAVAHDPILKGKSGFLNPTFFVIWTFLAIGLWSFLGYRIRKISSEADQGPMSPEQGKAYIWKNTVNASLFIVWFALTVGSTIHWLWTMSIDPHWYSTMFSWYNFASTFVSGMSLIAIWVIFMKKNNYLELTNQEHIHDIGKFMFGFSIFWTYLWFSQFMLIWYANIPEETVYFYHRMHGPYKFFFYANLVINFVCPILILMKRKAKRNYNLMIFMSILIILGHWMDFYQEFMGSIQKSHANMGWLDFGVLCFFVGILLLGVNKALGKKPLIPVYHPFIKESVIHHV
ncbi:MAG: quinol:cytochrome C oxidoreductase [Alphaproteobacteria bacterium]|nr:quinol:cytochrome C oxidoreductase [Alphaproteobacteria bacterium]